jgi:cytochrome c55X
VIAIVANSAFADTISAQRKGALLNFLKHDCGSCHGLTMKGGLGPSLLPADLDGKMSEYLVDVIMDGVPGTPMPPWRPELSREEAAWLVDRLKEGTLP